MKAIRKAIFVVLVTGLTAAGKPLPGLAAYVGKYPSDKVSGVSLRDHPQFRTLVSRAAPSAAIRTTVLASGVESPVRRQGALLVVQMCEPHNCGGHQWTVAIRSPGGPAAICYRDSDVTGEDGRWFVGGALLVRTRGCWQGSHEDVPRAVVTRLARGR